MESRSFHCFDLEEEVMFSEEEKEVNKMNHDDDTRDWAGLPVELLEKIHSLLLYGHDYDGPTRFRFHLTCKSWQNIRMNHPQHQHPVLFSIPTHSIQSAQRFQQIPLLISTFTWNHGNHAGTCKLFHPAYMETYVIDYPEIAGASIVHSKYGWLLMHRDQGSFFFFNPFTRTTIDIIPMLTGFFNISFTAPPTSPDCMIFSRGNSIRMHCFRLGQDEDWREYQISYENKMELESAVECPMCSPVFYKGGFYWFDINGKLRFFNTEEVGNNCYKKVVGPYISAHMNYIAEYDGELYTIAVGKNGSFVRVFKLDCNGAKVLSSVELKSLGNKTIYISDIGTLLVPAKVEDTENKIFFPRFVDKECIYYSLRTCRYHFFGCTSSRGDWNNTKVINHCAWIEPDVNHAECGNNG